MKTKFLLLAPIAALSLSACSLTGVRHEISEYVLTHEKVDMTGKSEFRILQLTDLHLGDKCNVDLQLKFTDLTVNEASADMIIVTGDLFTFASKTTALKLFDYLDSKEVPWTVTFGNHDEQCYFSVDWLTDTLNNYGSYCVFKDIQNDDVHGNANFAINLTKDGSVFEQIIVMDSNRYYFGSYFGYDFFKPDQIEWYQRLMEYNKTQNGGSPIKSTMWYHIPLPEIDDAYEYGVANDCIEYGEKREKTCPPEYNSGFFEVIKQEASTRAMFFGHDHINDFRVTYQGVTFCYGIKGNDQVYYDDDMMGGQVISIHDDHSLTYQQYLHTYAEVK